MRKKKKTTAAMKVTKKAQLLKLEASREKLRERVRKLQEQILILDFEILNFRDSHNIGW